MATGSKDGAISLANMNLESPREFGRFSIFSNKGDFQVLSLAVEGGGRQLRSFRNIEELKLSEHGDWRRIHLAALETMLGRKPFFPHLEEGLKEVYRNRDITTLKDFNTAIFEVVCSFLIENISHVSLNEWKKNSSIRERGKEILASLDGRASVVEAISDYGKETLLALMALE